MKTLESYNISPRVAVKPGSVVRIIGYGGDLGRHFGGLYEVVSIHQKRTRIYVDVWGIDKVGGQYSIYVKGPKYKRFGLKWIPYKLKRVK